MFPIRDHNPSQGVPLVTWALIAANVAVFLAQLSMAGQPGGTDAFVYRWALIPAALGQGHWGGLVTHMFVHAGLLHLAGNMLFLWIFGDNLEDQMGHLPFLAFYLACGLAAGGVQVLADPASPIPVVGASGAIGGVMGGYFLLFPRARIDILLILIVFFRVFTVPAFVMLGLWLLFQVGGGLTAHSDQGGVAYWAHTGGFAAGLVLTLPLWLRRGGTGWWQENRGKPPHPGVAYNPANIPVIRRRK